ncbi:DPH4 homolog [Paramacrobiotus metropolitanus]|uniref:DPH4 homolog n=1 Tax=Paramacrobiotus metropolitanus TaxID=2943436 RepID=UPI002445C097|nr:DPH4 homolog [Paramacrobiotus metropolitanus]
MPLHNYYESLELSSQCSAEDIKESYRRLAKQLHPDKSNSSSNSPADPSRFLLISEAYRVLSNPEIRKEYDKCRRDAEKAHLIYAEVDLSDLVYLEDFATFSYPCRCGDSYCLSQDRLKTTRTPQLVIPCSSCSFVLLVNRNGE